MRFGWIDYSREDSSIIDSALRELGKTSVEQLGFSSARNNLRAVLFPGAATPMTRLRYNYLVAYVANNLEHLKKLLRVKTAEEAQFRAEQKMRDILYQGEDRYGMYGIRNRNRVPHRVYWYNLYSYGLVDREDYPGYGTYFDELDTRARRNRDARSSEGENMEEHSFRFVLEDCRESERAVIRRLEKSSRSSANDPVINFTLTGEETWHFENTVAQKHPHSLLNTLVKDRKDLLADKEDKFAGNDGQVLWRIIEKKYLHGPMSRSLPSTLAKSLGCVMIFNRLMGVAYSYYNAALYDATGDNAVKERLVSLGDDTLDAINRYGCTIDEALAFSRKWTKGDGESFLRNIYTGIREKKDSNYFVNLVTKREEDVKDPRFAKLARGQREDGDWQPRFYGYDMNIGMVQRYLEDMRDHV